MRNTRGMSDREQIATGVFFTEAELRAKPHLRRLQRVPDRAASDPNNRPVSAEAKRMWASGGVCAYCFEPGDETSALIKTARNNLMHPECDEAGNAEHPARHS